MAVKFNIKTTSSFFLVLCLTVILFLTLSCFSTDPDPLQDFCVADLNSTNIMNGFPCKPESQVTSDDFFYSGLMNEPSTDNPFGLGVVRGDVFNFPGVNTLGLTVSRADLAPGGIIPLHVMKVGELSIIPRGRVHFAANVGPRKAVLLAIFNSQFAGFASISNLFASTPTIPNDILAKNFRVDEEVIAIIKSKFALNGSLAIATWEDI
ncbi:hypothetical protein MKX01_034047 [Papaver californicum]|nr:hypothetical protein MKX01_034047 [Papaver californicum]